MATTDAATWVAGCQKVGLRTGVVRGLVHVVIDESGWRNCWQGGQNDPVADGPVTPTTRVCMFCRELPGRERHWLEVTNERPGS